jgi:hypothetical protein
MKKEHPTKAIVNFLDKKTAELEGTIILKELYPIDPNKADKHQAFKYGLDIGRLKGQRDVLLQLTQLLKMY